MGCSINYESSPLIFSSIPLIPLSVFRLLLFPLALVQRLYDADQDFHQLNIELSGYSIGPMEILDQSLVSYMDTYYTEKRSVFFILGQYLRLSRHELQSIAIPY